MPDEREDMLEDGADEAAEEQAPPAETPADTTAEASEGDETPEAVTQERPAKPGKKSRVFDMVVVVVLVALVCGTVFYWSEVKAAVLLQAWSKSGPRKAMGEVQAGLESGDLDRVQKVMRDAEFGFTVEGEKIVRIKCKRAPQAPENPIDDFMPTGSLGKAPVEFDLRPNRVGAMVSAPTPAGRMAQYTLLRDADGWYMIAFFKGLDPDA